MDTQYTKIKHYALLIGINTYRQKPLKGCVRDVQSIKAYLEGGLNPVHIEMLTATAGNEQGSTTPIELPMYWPTYENVTSALRRVTALASPGDFVYIHFSGHGTRGTPNGAFSNRSTGDLALVLLDQTHKSGVRYLWGPELSGYVKAMVDKELVVTLVLDCCFSASVYRWDDRDNRFLPFDPEIDALFPLDTDKSLDSPVDVSENREVSMLPNWLISPDWYAILVACGPNEEAREARFDGERHGALSYCLLRTLTECGGLLSRHKEIYDHLCAKFQSYGLRPQQNPVLYGNKNLSFFGYSRLGGSFATTLVVVKKDGGFELPAGEAHGVSAGDQFLLRPMDYTERSVTTGQNSVMAKVAQVKGLTSILEPLETTTLRPRTGWVASALTKLALRRFKVRLDEESLPYHNEWVVGQTGGLLHIHVEGDNSPCAFHVVKDSNRYEIRDDSNKRVDNLPHMLYEETDANQIFNILEHLARYRLVKELTNNTPADAFSQSFNVRITSRSGEIFNPGCLIEVKHEEAAKFTLTLEIRNLRRENLYIYIYNLGPDWQVANIYHGTYEAIPQLKSIDKFTGTLTKRFKTKVPLEMRKKGYQECEDIIKIFVTSEPTSFDVLELPKLGELVKAKEPIRGGSKSSTDISQSWAALSFTVRTSL